MSIEDREVALKMRKAGQNDGAILLALSQRGLSPTDADEVVRSLGGGAFALAENERVESEWNQTSSTSGDVWLLVKGAIGLSVLIAVLAGGASLGSRGGVMLVKGGLLAVVGIAAFVRLLSRTSSGS